MLEWGPSFSAEQLYPRDAVQSHGLDTELCPAEHEEEASGGREGDAGQGTVCTGNFWQNGKELKGLEIRYEAAILAEGAPCVSYNRSP